MALPESVERPSSFLEPDDAATMLWLLLPRTRSAPLSVSCRWT